MRAVERLAVGGEEEARPLAGAKRRLAARALEGGERPAGGGKHLERAQDALTVRGPEPRGGLGVGRRELGVQVGRRAALGRRADPDAQRLGHGRHVRQALGQRPKIKARAADENHRPIAGPGQDLARAPRPKADGKVDRAVDFAEETVRRLPLLRARRTRGEDAQVGIDLHRVRR